MLSSHFLLVLTTIFSLAATKSTSPVVSLDYGTFQGVYDGNLIKFLGVPFSSPTARFELPHQPAPLDGLQNATAFGPACPQQALSLQLIPNHTFVSEECLTLDVFTPAGAHPDSKLPILVWLFGDFRGAVERSILLGVAPNYRVSAFGFLAGKEVSEAGITNLGLRDQIFALEWVQKHIVSFGGDSERVVLGGLSAGSISTSLLLLSNKRTSSSLSRGAFMVSGPPWPSPTVADGQPYYDELVAANNCTQALDMLDCLRNVPFDSFLATVNKTPDILSYRSIALVWRPRVDGDIILRNPIESVVKGAFAKIPIRAGDADDEGTSFAFANLNITTNTEFVEYIQSKIAELYPQDPAQGSPFGTGLANQLTPEFKRIAAFEGDFFLTGLRRFFVQHASTTQNTWSWLSKRGKSTPDLGAAHGSDMPLFFPTNTTIPVDNVAVDALINFLNTLDPNQSAAPAGHRSNASVFWPKLQTPSTEGSSSLLTFSDPVIVNITADDFRAEPIQFLIDLHVEGWLVHELMQCTLRDVNSAQFDALVNCPPDERNCIRISQRKKGCYSRLQYRRREQKNYPFAQILILATDFLVAL
ncbi:Alpha/Beta hydrolase protein [Mycena epipterygia]|nr:Alpha/Beta hydrolase protein [Mycena epipterygia]